MIRKWALWLAFAASFAASAHAAIRDPLVRFRAAHVLFVPYISSDGYDVSNMPAAAVALRAQWSAARDLVVDWLTTHPGGSVAGLSGLAGRSVLTLNAVSLGRGALLVGATSGAFGTVFLVSPDRNGRYRSTLTLDDLPAATLRAYPALAAWNPTNAGPKCRAMPGAMAWSRCGPQAPAFVLLLPKEAGGARRFAVIGDYVMLAGGTEAYQVSLWRWDGRAATPLLLRTMAQALDEPLLIKADARGFTLHAREEFKTLQSCGSCSGRQVELRFDTPVTGVAPPRTRSLYPDLDLIDRLFARLAAHRSIRDIAAPSVATGLRGVEPEMTGPWRMLDRTVRGRHLCLDDLSFDRPRVFEITTRAGRPWISRVTRAPSHACDGPGSKS